MSVSPKISVARVPTQSASKYIQQLAKHWSHKMEVTYTPEEARIAFPGGAVLEMRADSDTLDVALTVPEDGPEGADVARMREVVSSHLDRFAFREAPLTFDWADA